MGKESTPSIAPESLHTDDTIKVVDLVCEGPIEGLVDGLKSIYLNEIPVEYQLGIYAQTLSTEQEQAGNTGYSFLKTDGNTAVTAQWTYGVAGQTPLLGFDDVESETAVNMQVLKVSPVLRSIPVGVDRIRIRLGIDSLYNMNSSGDISAADLDYKVEVIDSTLTDWPTYQVSQKLDMPSGNINVVSGTEIQVTVPDNCSQIFLPVWVILPQSGPDDWHKAFGRADITFQGRKDTDPEGTWAPIEFATVTPDPWPMDIFAVTPVPLLGGIPAGALDAWKVQNKIVVPGYSVGTIAIFGKSSFIGQYDKVRLVLKASYPALSNALPASMYIATSFMATSASWTGQKEVSLGVQYSTAGTISGHSVVSLRKVHGRYSSRVMDSFEVTLPGTGPWQVRVSKITADTYNVENPSSLTWESYTEIIDSKLQYPNCAIFGMSIWAKQFSSIPRRAYRLRLLQVRVPSNYFPKTRKYTRIVFGANKGNDAGVEQEWDGEFYTAWTSNPAWCYYDILTHPRYGLGNFIDERTIDKWSLYNIARYCDELVPSGYNDPDGNPIMEPRFTLNCYITERAEAYVFLQQLTSVFRTMSYWCGGNIIAAQDSPSDPVATFGPANVVNGEFFYASSSKKARHTVAVVTWSDPADFYRPKVEYVEDTAGIRRYGLNILNTPAFGCTSRGQARRQGKWLLYSEIRETETVTFSTGWEGVYLRPGNVMLVADPNRAGVRWAGRLKACDAQTFTLDAPVTLDKDVAYNLTVVLPDGSLAKSVISHSSVEDVTTDFITIVDPLTTLALPGAIWVIEAPNVLVTQKFRVVSIREPNPGVYEVVGLEHQPGKYNLIELGINFDDEPISGTPLITAAIAPSGLAASIQKRITTGGIPTQDIVLNWTLDARCYFSRFEIRYSTDGGVIWATIPPVYSNTATIPNVPSGTYLILVRTIAMQGSASGWASTQIVVSSDIVGVVPNITGLRIFGQAPDNTSFEGRDCKLVWDFPTITVDPVATNDNPQYQGWLAGYTIKVYNADGVTLRRTETLKSTDIAYTYTHEKNHEDGSGNATRSFVVTIVANDIWGKVSAIPASITVSNPIPPAIT